MSHVDAKCPGIEIEPGVFSGCLGGADCPVCRGRAKTLHRRHSMVAQAVSIVLCLSSIWMQEAWAESSRAAALVLLGWSWRGSELIEDIAKSLTGRGDK